MDALPETEIARDHRQSRWVSSKHLVCEKDKHKVTPLPK
jgi:hypothetical protein